MKLTDNIKLETELPNSVSNVLSRSKYSNCIGGSKKTCVDPIHLRTSGARRIRSWAFSKECLTQSLHDPLIGNHENVTHFPHS